jgi:hypothetical protein
MTTGSNVFLMAAANSVTRLGEVLIIRIGFAEGELEEARTGRLSLCVSARCQRTVPSPPRR